MNPFSAIAEGPTRDRPGGFATQEEMEAREAQMRAAGIEPKKFSVTVSQRGFPCEHIAGTMVFADDKLLGSIYDYDDHIHVCTCEFGATAEEDCVQRTIIKTDDMTPEMLDELVITLMEHAIQKHGWSATLTGQENGETISLTGAYSAKE